MFDEHLYSEFTIPELAKRFPCGTYLDVLHQFFCDEAVKIHCKVCDSFVLILKSSNLIDELGWFQEKEYLQQETVMDRCLTNSE